MGGVHSTWNFSRLGAASSGVLDLARRIARQVRTAKKVKEKLPPEWQDFGRVQFHRAFPFDAPEEFISVLNMDGKEYGIIRSLSDFEGEARELLQIELERKYLAPAISKILSLKDKLGFSYWEVETDHGKKSFTMQDTYRNMFKNSENGVVLTDVDGNRFIIKDVLALDAKSYRKIELYL